MNGKSQEENLSIDRYYYYYYYYYYCLDGMFGSLILEWDLTGR